MKELVQVGQSEIDKYKSLQRKILSIRNIIEIQKDKKEKTTKVSNENCQNIFREFIDNEPEEWIFSRSDLESIISDLQAKCDSIHIEKVEEMRLEKLLEKAGIVEENGKSSIEV